MSKIIFEGNFQKQLDEKSWTENCDFGEVEKLIQACEVHGYRGASKKKHNGIVPVRPSDSNLIKILHKLTNQADEDIQKKCKNGLPIKVVAHVTTGWRMVGYKCIDKDIIILGFANYDKSC